MPGSEKRKYIILAVILLLAFLFRALFSVCSVRDYVPYGDERVYEELARNLLAGYGIATDTGSCYIDPGGTPTSLWGFLYPAFLASVFGMFGDSYKAVFLFQALINTFLCLVVFLFGARLFGERYGYAAAGITALHIYFIYFCRSLYTEILFVTLFTAAILAAYRAWESGKNRDFLLAGILLGLSALTRSVAFYFFPFLAAAMVLGSVKPRRRTLGGLCITAAGLALVILPWTARNALVHGEFVLLDTKAGFNLYISNHPAHNRSWMEEEFDSEIQRPTVRGMTEPERDRLLRTEAFGFIRDDPRRFLRLSTKKLYYLWSPFPGRLTDHAYRWIKVLFLLPFLSLSAAGMFLTRRSWRRLLPLYAVFLYFSLVHLVLVGGPRFRLPADPFLILFAAVPLVWAVDRIRRRA
jgi:4-amino-4-deoxy-L-arabinose transferase-like glycosyltransferase